MEDAEQLRPEKRRRTWIALIPFVVALFAVPAFVLLSEFAPGHEFIVWWTTLFVILLFDVPACLLVVVGVVVEG